MFVYTGQRGDPSLKERLHFTAQYPHCQELFGCQSLPAIFLAYGLWSPRNNIHLPEPVLRLTDRTASERALQAAEANRLGANQMLTATPPPGNPKWKEASREIAFRDRYRQPEGNTCPGDTGREKHQDVNIVFYRFHNRPQAKPVGIHVMLCRTR